MLSKLHIAIAIGEAFIGEKQWAIINHPLLYDLIIIACLFHNQLPGLCRTVIKRNLYHVESGFKIKYNRIADLSNTLHHSAGKAVKC